MPLKGLFFELLEVILEFAALRGREEKYVLRIEYEEERFAFSIEDEETICSLAATCRDLLVFVMGYLKHLEERHMEIWQWEIWRWESWSCFRREFQVPSQCKEILCTGNRGTRLRVFYVDRARGRPPQPQERPLDVLLPMLSISSI